MFNIKDFITKLPLRQDADAASGGDGADGGGAPGTGGAGVDTSIIDENIANLRQIAAEGQRFSVVSAEVGLQANTAGRVSSAGQAAAR